MTTTKLKIAGMHCASCKALIEDAAGDLPGVRSCAVDYGKEEAVVEHDVSLDPADLVEEIQGLGGYKVTIV